MRFSVLTEKTVNNAPIELNIQTLLLGRQWFHSSFFFYINIIIIIIIAKMTAGSSSQHPKLRRTAPEQLQCAVIKKNYIQIKDGHTQPER